MKVTITSIQPNQNNYDDNGSNDNSKTFHPNKECSECSYQFSPVTSSTTSQILTFTMNSGD